MKITLEVEPLARGKLAGLRHAVVGGEVNEGETHAGTEFGVEMCMGGTALWWHVKRPDEEANRYYSISMAEVCNALIHATLEDTEGACVIDDSTLADQGGGE